MYVIYCQSGKEMTVVRQLAEKNITAYAPRRLVQERHRRRWVQREVLLFSGYVFLDAELTPDIWQAVKFCEGVQRDFGRIEDIYADSAEQTLISGLREYIKPLDLTVKNSMKRPIIDRIRATTMLMGGERFLMTSDCETLRDAFQGAVYDDKVVGEDIRLDNGTSDIDTLDAFEYSFERYIPRLIRRD